MRFRNPIGEFFGLATNMLTRKRNNSRVLLLLAFIVVAGFLLRLYQLGQAPSGALIDEAHFGYIAYSLLETGKDEHGIAWPIVFKGFGDQKLPIYAYLMVPVVALAQLSVLSIRIPSLVAGVFAILGMFLVAREYFRDTRTRILVASITAFSPSMLFLSRFGFEANVAMCLFIFGWWLLLKGMRTDSHWNIVVAGMLWASTWYGYIAFRPITFLLTIIASTYLYKTNQKNLAFRLLIVFCLIVLPWFLPLTSGSNTARLKQVGITADPGIAMMIDEQRTFCAQEQPKWLCYGFFNKPITIGLSLVSRYLSSFSAPFLSTNGEVDLHFLSVKSFGQFQFILYPFFLVGLIALVAKNNNLRKIELPSLLLLSGILVALLPAIVSGEPQKVRLTPWWPFVIVCMAYGWNSVAQFLSNKTYWKSLLLGTAFALIVFEGVRYIVVFTHYHVLKHDDSYQSYVPKIAQFVEESQEQTLVVVKPFFSDPIMFLAFYLKLDPTFYQKNAELGELEPSGFQHTARLGNWVALSLEPAEIACMAKVGNYQRAIYITNNDYSDLTSIERFLSINGVLSYAKAYEVPLDMCNQ